MEKEETKNIDKSAEEKLKKTDKEEVNLEDHKNETEEKQIGLEEDEITVLKDKVARAYAEMENQRRRFEKEKDEAFEYGGFAFAKEALNLIDNLERSKNTLENDEALKGSEALNKLIEHLNIIDKDMLTIFKKNNIEPIKAIGEKLDPNLHQAMMEIDDNSKVSGTIVQEIQKGFTMKDRLLRPSLVAVSKKKDVKDEPKIKKSEENQEKNDEN